MEVKGYHDSREALVGQPNNKRQQGCTCDKSQRPKAGSYNWVIFLTFDDGVQWAFRSPRKAFGLPEDIANEVLLSEVATLEYLAEAECIPVPKVYSYCSTGQNDIGVPYILMSKASGVPLSTYKWNDDGVGGNHDQTVLSFHQKEQIMKQLGEIYAHLSNLRFDKAGSLYSKDGSYVVGKCLYPPLVWEGRDEFDEQGIPRGPFAEPEPFYKALILAFFAHVKELPMEHHLFHGPVPIPQEYRNFHKYRVATDRWNDYVAIGSKVESSQNRLDYALVGMSLEESVPSLVESDVRINCEGFPFCHPDLSSQNMFVDDELNIVCVIDWDFASLVPPSVLLVCPGLPHPRDRTCSRLREAFAKAFALTQGFNAQEDIDFSNGSVVWSFSRLINLDGLQDYVHFYESKRSLGSEEVFLHVQQFRDREEFQQVSRMLAAYNEEQSSDDEKQYFSCVGLERFALSQHLTVMAELNKRFLADRRLWKWMEQYLSGKDLYMYPSHDR